MTTVEPPLNVTTTSTGHILGSYDMIAPYYAAIYLFDLDRGHHFLSVPGLGNSHCNDMLKLVRVVEEWLLENITQKSFDYGATCLKHLLHEKCKENALGKATISIKYGRVDTGNNEQLGEWNVKGIVDYFKFPHFMLLSIKLDQSLSGVQVMMNDKRDL